MNHTGTGERRVASDVSSAVLAASSISVSLTVDDLAVSTQWYRDVLGFTIEREFERDGVRFAARLRAGAAEMLLTQDDGAKGSRRAKGDGFSISFTTARNIDD